MEIKGKKYRIGSWARPYIEELLKGGHVHNPTFYLEGKARRIYKGKSNKEGGWFNGYTKSWFKALEYLSKEGINVIRIYHYHPGKGDTIFVLEKYFKRLLKNRLIDQYGNSRLYRLEDRNLFFRDCNVSAFAVVSPKYNTIGSLLAEEVEKKLDESLGTPDRVYITI